jgi:hypothetical protein
MLNELSRRGCRPAGYGTLPRLFVAIDKIVQGGARVMLDDRGKLNSVETANPSTPSFVPSEEYKQRICALFGWQEGDRVEYYCKGILDSDGSLINIVPVEQRLIRNGQCVRVTRFELPQEDKDTLPKE